MKRFFIALAAMAAMVGCSKENIPSEVITKDNFTVDAKIVVDDTRVTVEGEKFTDVKWELEDEVTLASEAGAKATLTATESGDVVRFRGEGTYAADVDTYYAIYPSVDIVDGIASKSLEIQTGDDAAVLAAATSNAPKGVIDMVFTPQNALLHVSVTNGVTLAKAELKAFDGSMLPKTYIYNFKQGKPSAEGEVASYVIENPSNSFFFALPADLDLAGGYIIYLTDSKGNVCSKAYNGKKFEKATTTRVDIEFAAPKVNLGEPMTSYSYYNAKNTTKANECANNVIYFPNATTISNLQNAMVKEVGYIVDGTEYKVNYNNTNKSFNMAQNHAVSSWGAKSVEAYVVTTDGRRYSDSATVHITGLPYTLNVKDNDIWKKGASLSSADSAVGWNESSAVRLGKNQGAGDVWIETSSFILPADVNVNVVGNGVVNGTGNWIKVSNTVSISVSGTEIFSDSQNGKSEKSWSCNSTGSMKASSPSVKVNSSYNLEAAKVLVKSLIIKYGNK